jgi:hypothetical protein
MKKKSRFDREIDQLQADRAKRVRAQHQAELIAREAPVDDAEDVPVVDPIREELRRQQAEHAAIMEEDEDDEEEEDDDEDKDEDEDGDDDEGEEGDEEEGVMDGLDKSRKKKKKRCGRPKGSGRFGSGKSFIYHPSITSLVDLDRTQLSPKALKDLEGKEAPELMRLCLMAPETEKIHYPGLLSVNSTSNLNKHFKSHHPKFWVWMETSLKSNNKADVSKALATFLETHQRGSTGKSMRQLRLMNFAGRVKESGMEPGAEKEIMECLRIIDTDASFESVQTPVSRVWDMVLNFRRPDAAGVKDRATLISIAVRQMRKRQLTDAGFFSTTMDFATVQRKSMLLITYHTISPSFDIRNMCLDCLEFPTTHHSPLIAIAAQECIDRHTSDDTVQVHSTTDGANNISKASRIIAGDLDLLAAGEITVSDVLEDIKDCGNAGLCMSHGLHLIAVEVLGHQGSEGSAAAICRDLAFIHSFAMYLSTYEHARKTFFELQELDGVKRPLKVLSIECETRWPDKFLALERFVVLRPYIEVWYRDHSEMSISNDAKAPPDALLPAFWRRLVGAKAVLHVFQDASVSLQTEKTIVASFLPRVVWQLRNACIRVEPGIGVEGDCNAVAVLKDKLLLGIEKYMQYALERPSAALKAAVLDPNEANLEHYGVHSNVVDDTWESIVEEVQNFSSPANVTLAKYAHKALRRKLEEMSKAIQANPKSPRHDVLEFWKGLASTPPAEDITGAIFAKTARAILSSQLSSAASERRVKAARRIMTNESTNIHSITAEDRLVIRDWLKEEPFTMDKFKELIKEICSIIVAEKMK